MGKPLDYPLFVSDDRGNSLSIHEIEPIEADLPPILHNLNSWLGALERAPSALEVCKITHGTPAQCWLSLATKEVEADDWLLFMFPEIYQFLTGVYNDTPFLSEIHPPSFFETVNTHMNSIAEGPPVAARVCRTRTDNAVRRVEFTFFGVRCVGSRIDNVVAILMIPDDPSIIDQRKVIANLRRAKEAALQLGSNLTMMEYLILIQVYFDNLRGVGCSVKTLTVDLHYTRPSLSRTVNRLVEKNYIVKSDGANQASHLKLVGGVLEFMEDER